MVMQVVVPLSNRKSLCIGEITTREAESAGEDDPSFNGQGLYLVEVDSQSPSEPGAVLAKFLTEEAAATLAQFFRLYGRLEKA